MSNSLGSEQARRTDLGPNCLPRLSADDTGRQRVLRDLFKWVVLKLCIYSDIKINLKLNKIFMIGNKSINQHCKYTGFEEIQKDK